MQYTRAGNFTRNANGDLVTQDGFYVMGAPAAGGAAPQAINIPNGATNLSIGQDGAVSYDPAGGGARVTAGYLTLAKFPNEGGLERTSSNRWKAGASSGAETVNTPGGNFGPDHLGHGRDVERRPRLRVHEHDHRAARLPGQLARDLDLRRAAPGPRQPQALVALTR